MKKTFFLVIAFMFSTFIYAQNNMNKVVFVFDNIDNFTSQFENRETPKEFSFTIRNLEDSQLEILKNNISNYRGVTSITISDADENGERTADLVLYKYADHWKYYEYFFSKNGIFKIEINNNEYNPAQIGNQ
jgi:hypothetical protein